MVLHTGTYSPNSRWGSCQGLIPNWITCRRCQTFQRDKPIMPQVGPDGPDWEAPVVEPGTALGELGPLFSKVELEPEE